MINLLLSLIFLACVGIGAAWMAQHPGSVTIHWFDYRIDTSFGFLLLLAAVTVVFLVLAIMVVRGVIGVPGRFSRRRSLAHYEKGLAELTWGVAALASADIAGAQTHTRKAEKLLGRTPLTLLLSAQIARNLGDDATTRALMEKMLDHKETEYLAARSLSEVASKQRLFPKALALAERAQSINPKGVDSVVSLHVRLGQWQEALLAIGKAKRKGSMTRADSRRYSGIVHLQQARQWLDAGRSDMALNPARHALKELPGFMPAIMLAARALAANKQQSKAVQLILQSWKQSPQMPLADLLRTILANETHEKRTKIMKKLAAIHPEPVTVATTWVCRSCHHSLTQWEPHCAGCGSFDTMEWRETIPA